MNVRDALLIDQGSWNDFWSGIKASQIVVLTDTHTHEHCYPIVKDSGVWADPFMITIQPGEASKSLDCAKQIWQRMLHAHIDRHAVMVAIGGGVVTDLGGFIAANYKRGIRLVNVPTTHLGMTDAALGGKNGVNFGGLKNQIGTVLHPMRVWLDPRFLKSLPEAELRSGWIETVKHALIADRELWNQLKEAETPDIFFGQNILLRSAEIKLNIAAQDEADLGIRQALNFGHTVGHALEASSNLLHGEAVAFGIAAELYLSNKIVGLAQRELETIIAYLQRYREPLVDTEIRMEEMIKLMEDDKKNHGGEIRFSLIPDIGKVKTGIPVDRTLIAESIEFAQSQLMT